MSAENGSRDNVSLRVLLVRAIDAVGGGLVFQVAVNWGQQEFSVETDFRYFLATAYQYLSVMQATFFFCL